MLEDRGELLQELLSAPTNEGILIQDSSKPIAQQLNTKPQKYSFEEFKLYYESAEKVTDRRLSNNNWNYSICTAIFVAIGGAWSWMLTNTTFSFVVLNATSVLCIVAILFTTLWINQIKDFKSLNKAKFEVLNEMAEKVSFNESHDRFDLVSCNPFAKEWEKLQRMQAVKRGRMLDIVALRSSDSEIFVPHAFRVIFTILLFISIIPIFLKWNQTLEAWIRFLNI